MVAWAVLVLWCCSTMVALYAVRNVWCITTMITGSCHASQSPSPLWCHGQCGITSSSWYSYVAGACYYLVLVTFKLWLPFYFSCNCNRSLLAWPSMSQSRLNNKSSASASAPKRLFSLESLRLHDAEASSRGTNSMTMEVLKSTSISSNYSSWGDRAIRPHSHMSAWVGQKPYQWWRAWAVDRI
jgi:hypothetical protein